MEKIIRVWASNDFLSGSVKYRNEKMSFKKSLIKRFKKKCKVGKSTDYHLQHWPDKSQLV